MYKLFNRQSGTGHTIVLIHGVVGSSLVWQPMIDKLSSDFHLVAIDLLGYGHSPKPKIVYDPSTHNQAIHGTVEELNIKKPYTVAGLSMGAILAIEYATTYADEVSNVICIGVPYYRTKEEARAGLKDNIWTHMAMSHPHVSRLIMPLIVLIVRRFKYLRERFARPVYTGQMAKEALMTPYYVFKSSLDNCLASQNLLSTISKLGRIPLLIIDGANDKWCPTERVRSLSKTYKNSVFMVIDGAAHNTVVSAPQQTSEDIKSFLARR